METNNTDEYRETSGDMDEIWAMFMDESVEHIANIEECLLALEEDAGDEERIDSLFRSIHTVKGMARMIGLETLGNFVHRAEDIVGLIRDEGVSLDTNITDLLIEALDEIREMVAIASDSRKDPDIPHPEVLERLNAMFRGKGGKPGDESPDMPEDSNAESAGAGHDAGQESGEQEDSPEEFFSKAEEINDPSPEISGDISVDKADGVPDSVIIEQEPEDMEAFLFLMDEEFPAFLKGVENCLNGDARPEDIMESLEMLSLASDQMGFGELHTLFISVEDAVSAGKGQDGDDKKTDALYSLVSDTVDLLEKIYDRAREMGVYDKPFPFVMPKVDGPVRVSADDDISLPDGSGSSEETGDPQQPYSSPAHDDMNDDTNIETASDTDVMEQDNSDMEDGIMAIDPATDPESIRAFLFLVEEEFPLLRTAMERAARGEAGLDDLEEAVETISFAAGQMGYNLLRQAVDELLGIGDISHDERSSRLDDLGNRIYDELSAIYNIAKDLGVETTLSQSDLSSLFIQQLAGDALAEIARLGEAGAGLGNFIEEMDRGGSALSDADRQCAETAIECLRNLYHYCSFYELEPAARLSLMLEDLYSRLFNGIISVSPELADITLQFQQELQNAVEAGRDGREYALSGINALAERAADVISIQGDNRIARVSKKILDLLEISPGIREVVTAENLHEIASLIKDSAFFYEVRADIDSEPDVAEKFLEWSNQVTLITNETLYEDDRSLYNFLLATHRELEEVEASIREIDPSEQFLAVRQCAVKDDAMSEHLSAAEEDVPPAAFQGKSDVNEGNLQQLLSGIEDITEARSMLHYAVETLSDMDMQEYLDSLARESSQGEMLAALLMTLVQADGQMGTALGRIQESARELKTGLAGEIMQNLVKTVRTLTGSGDVNVELRTRGDQVAIDRDILACLEVPLDRLVWFCVKKAAGTREARVALGMESRAGLDVAISRTGDHVMATVTVDGPGIGEAVIIDEAVELAHAMEKMLSEHRCRVRAEAMNDHTLRFALYFPFINTIMDAMVVKKGAVQYVIPIKVIQRILKPEKNDISTASADGQRVLRHEDDLVPIVSIHGGLNAEKVDGEDSCPLLVVVENHDASLAMPVDELVGQQQVMMKPLSGALTGISGAAGCAILGGGDVGLVMDVNALTQFVPAH